MLNAFLSLLRGDPPGRIVWTADITYWIAGQKAVGKADRAWDTEESYLQLHRDLGIMPYYYYDKFWTGMPQYSRRIEISQKSRGNRTLHQIETPVGTLTQENEYLPSSCSTGCVKHFVESERDLDVFLRHRRGRTACVGIPSGQTARLIPGHSDLPFDSSSLPSRIINTQ